MSPLLLALALCASAESPMLPAGAPGAVAGPPEVTPAASLAVPAAHAALLMGGMRLSLSLLWPDAFNPLPVRRSLENLGTNWSQGPEFHATAPLFESDGDPVVINALGHGLFGSELYLRARRCGHSPLAALAGTALVSTFWEYGVEAFHKRPSAVDLVWTPLSGIVFGELRYRLQEAAGGTFWRAVVDPLGEAGRALGAGC